MTSHVGPEVCPAEEIVLRRPVWESAWGRFTAYDKYGVIGEVVAVSDGWAARTSNTDLGVYLTVEMARGAVMGMHEIEVHGSYYALP